MQEKNRGASEKAFVHDFNANLMNLIWVYTMDPDVNADAAAEEGTTAWDASASWSYETPFAKATLVVPQDTAPGTYVFDIRTEPYVNALSIGRDKPKNSKSYCDAAGNDGEVPFTSKALTIIVAEETTTSTTTTTTTTETTTTTTTTTTETTTTTTETTPAQNESYIEAEFAEIPALAPGESYDFTVKLTAVNTKIGSIQEGALGKVKTMSFSLANYDFGEEGTDSAEIKITIKIYT